MLVRWCSKDIGRGLADNGRPNREEVARDLDTASTKSNSKTVMEDEACARWIFGREDGVDSRKGTLSAGGVDGRNVVVLAVDHVVVIRTDREVVVD